LRISPQSHSLIGQIVKKNGSLRQAAREKDRRKPPEDLALAERCRNADAQRTASRKQAVAAERRAIKKSARRHLKRELLKELEEENSKSEARNPKQ